MPEPLLYAPQVDSLVDQVLLLLKDGPLPIAALVTACRESTNRLSKVLEAPVRHGWLTCSNDGTYLIGPNASATRRRRTGIDGDLDAMADASTRGSTFADRVSKVQSLAGTPFGSPPQVAPTAARRDQRATDEDSEPGRPSVTSRKADSVASPLPTFQPDASEPPRAAVTVEPRPIGARSVRSMAPIVRRPRVFTKHLSPITTRPPSEVVVPPTDRPADRVPAFVQLESIPPIGTLAPMEGVMPVSSSSSKSPKPPQTSVAAVRLRAGVMSDGSIAIQHDGRWTSLEAVEAGELARFLLRGQLPEPSVSWSATRSSDGGVTVQVESVAMSLAAGDAAPLLEVLAIVLRQPAVA